MRGRELKKGKVPWCCCCGLCSGSALVVKHLAQPNGVLGMDAGEMSLVRAAARGKSSWRSLQLQPGAREVKVKPTLYLRQNFVYRMLGALGQHGHKYLAGQTSRRTVRSVTAVMCTPSVIKRLCNSG